MIQVSVEPAFGKISERSIVQWCGAFVLQTSHSERRAFAKSFGWEHLSNADLRSPTRQPESLPLSLTVMKSHVFAI